MDKKEFFEKVLDRSAKELVKEYFPNGITTLTAYLSVSF